MPQKACIDAPGALHHIFVKGIQRRKAFDDDEGRDNFLERHMRSVTVASPQRLAYCRLLAIGEHAIWDQGPGKQRRACFG